MSGINKMLKMLVSFPSKLSGPESIDLKKATMAQLCEPSSTTCQEGQLGPSSWIGAELSGFKALSLLSRYPAIAQHSQFMASTSLPCALLANNFLVSSQTPAPSSLFRQAVFSSQAAQLWPRTQPSTAEHSENWTVGGGLTMLTQLWFQMVKAEQAGRMTREKKWYAHYPRATASVRARTRNQSPWLWAQTLPRVGHMTLSMVLSLGVSIHKMGH